MNFVIQEEREFRSVEVGTYTARLNKIEEKPPTQTNPDWGPSLMWEFIVLDDGPHRGDSVAAFTPAVPKTGNGLGKLLRQMMGRNLRPGEQLDGAALIGKPFTVYVDFNKTGTRTRVVSAVPIKTPAAPSSPPAAAPAPVPPAAQKLAAALAAVTLIRLVFAAIIPLVPDASRGGSGVLTQTSTPATSNGARCRS